MILTKGQINAIEDIKRWRDFPYRSEEDVAYVLEGAGGTGKTTVIKTLMKSLNGRIIAAAPTHAAKNVIGSITNLPAFTFHTLLGIRPDTNLADFHPNNVIFKQIGDIKLNTDIIIADEGSMVNKYLYKLLIKEAYKRGIRIIFLGDRYQLPPVNEKTSLIFLNQNRSELTEIVRQEKTNPSLFLLHDIRESIRIGNPSVENIISSATSNINISSIGEIQGYELQTDKDSFYNRIIEHYSDSSFIHSPNDYRVLAYTNKAVNVINKFVKNKINPSEDIVSSNDLLIGYKTNTPSNIKQNSTINGEEYLINSVNKRIVRIKGYSFTVLSVVTSKGNLDILHPESYDIFKVVMKDLLRKGKLERQWRPFYAFKENFLLLEDIYDDDEEVSYNNKNVIAYKDIDFGYAITVHKSQGSTYKNVSCLYTDFKYCRDVTERKHLLYVALSRAKQLNSLYVNS